MGSCWPDEYEYNELYDLRVLPETDSSINGSRKVKEVVAVDIRVT